MRHTPTMISGVLAAGLAASLALTGCSSESAVDYIAKQDASAREGLTKKVDEANKAAADRVKETNDKSSTTLKAFEAAMEKGDSKALLDLVDAKTAETINASGTLSAWKGAGGQVTIPEHAIEPVTLTVPSLDPSGEGLSPKLKKKEVFHDSEYVPTIDGKPWTDYDPVKEASGSEVPTDTIRSTWRVDGGKDQCLLLVRDGDSMKVSSDDTCAGPLTGVASPDHDDQGLLRVAERKYKDLTGALGNPSVRVLAGTYAVTVDPSVASALTVQPATTNISTKAPALVPSAKALEMARKHAKDWAAAVVAVKDNDPRCNTFGQDLTVNGVGTPTGPACGFMSNEDRDSLNFVKLDATETQVDVADDGTKLVHIQFSSKDDTAAISIKRFDSSGTATDYRAKTVTVTLALDAKGNMTYAPKDSIQASFW